jgi:predicted neuraminidase
MSRDGQWGKPKKLASRELECGKITKGPVRNKMVVLSNGNIIAPSSIERIVSRDTFPYQVEWNSLFHVSGNSGKTWKTTKVVGYDRKKYGQFGGIIQPAVWESSPGVASAFFRSTLGVLFRSDSSDGGLTWSDALPTGLPNPNSAVDVAVCGKILALVYNPVPINWGHRSPLSLSFSDLSGGRFTAPMDIEGGLGHFAYPSMIPTDFGLAITYTHNRRNIAFVEVKITKGKDVFGNQTLDVGLSNGIKPYGWLGMGRSEPADDAEPTDDEE